MAQIRKTKRGAGADYRDKPFFLSWALSNNLPQLLRLLHPREREASPAPKKEIRAPNCFAL
jgi:hypothetical protein